MGLLDLYFNTTLADRAYKKGLYFKSVLERTIYPNLTIQAREFVNISIFNIILASITDGFYTSYSLNRILLHLPYTKILRIQC